MRPTYETEETLRKEREIIIAFCSAMPFVFKKTPKFCPVDFFLYSIDKKGCPVSAVAEAKERDRVRQPGEILILSERKLKECWQIADQYGVPFLFITDFNGKIHYNKMKREYPVKMIGRKDRNDPLDIEPCAIIQTMDFVPIKGGE